VATSTAVGRIAAILALVGVLIIVLLLIFGGGDKYKVTAEFENASQLVNGNIVSVAGVSAGKISEIKLGDDGQALVEMEVSDEYAPLRQGTTATIRSQSLSGIANRYVELDMPPEDAAGAEIESGGTIAQVDTVSEVDLDQFFNTLDEPTIQGFKRVIKGFSRSYDGIGPQANKGFEYLNPFLSTSRRVFGELNRDQRAFERLIVDSSSLTSALAERGPDISQLVGNLNRMMGALGRRDTELAASIAALPPFMRQANTTFVNLRAALEDLDPLVNASKPAARKLRPFLAELRLASRDLVPAIRDLDAIVSQPGADNDLVELTQLQIPLAEIGVGPVNRNGASRPGALPASRQALDDSLHQLAFFRPYTPELVGWFDDFGHSGAYDVNGEMGVINTSFAFFSLINLGLPFDTPDAVQASLEAILRTNQRQRCPGANERPQTDPTGSIPFQPGGAQDPFQAGGQLDCDPDQHAGGIAEP
jgi:phospholipid/cholesterol/gamma-HCH transport system substrate-binding protein